MAPSCLSQRRRGNDIGRGQPGRETPMEFVQESAGGVLIVKLSGRLDSSTAQAAEDNFTRAIASGVTRIAIDMSGLDYISSAGLRILLVIAKKLQQAKGKVVLFGLVANVREVFSISGFDKIFTIRPNTAEALESVQ
jgi:anti-anti-sigma factor